MAVANLFFNVIGILLFTIPGALCREGWSNCNRPGDVGGLGVVDLQRGDDPRCTALPGDFQPSMKAKGMLRNLRHNLS